MVGFVRKANFAKFKPKEMKFRNYKNYNRDTVCRQLNKSDWTNVYMTSDVNDCWMHIKTILNDVFNKVAPITTK